MTRFLASCPILLFTTALIVANVGAQSAVQPSSPPKQPESPKSIHTLLLAGRVSTWLEVPEPPYAVAITIKSKLERAGFRVVFDPNESHDAVLVINYRETPGPEYGSLERGTKILCEVTLHPTAAGARLPDFAYRLETATSWPTPVGSLYWDAVQHLEENPYYYFMGDLLQGRLTSQDNAAEVFSKVLKQAPLTISTDGSDTPLTNQAHANQVARLDAIRELGLMKDRRAIETLWELVERPNEQERTAAVTAIGEIGDPAALDRLKQLYDSQSEASMRATVEKAMEQIRQAR